MVISKEQLHEDYKCFYKQIILNKNDNGFFTESITGLQYCKEDIREAKKTGAVALLINKYRVDFPKDWKIFLNFNLREDCKTKARKLFKEENLEGLDLLIKAYWGRTIQLGEWKNVMNITSYEEYASHFCSAILLKKEKTKSLTESFGLFGLSGSNEFLNRAVNYMNKKFNPTSFEKLKIFPGQTYLKEKELINMSPKDLDRGYHKSELEYISFIKIIKAKKIENNKNIVKCIK